MHEITRISSLSLLVGTGACNADCQHCAGRIHRQYAPEKDGVVDERLIAKTLKVCHVRGAKRLSVSSSGEPTLSPRTVTKVLQIVSNCSRSGFNYSPVNLYSNGIKIGEDTEFASVYLPLWKKLGLSCIYITVHDTSEEINARIYRVKRYPSLKIIFQRIHAADLSVRANLVLSRETVGTLKKFVSVVNDLVKIGADFVSAWPIRGQDDKINLALSPSKTETLKMRNWLRNSGLDNQPLQLPDKSGEKLTLFPNGQLSNTWCNN